MDRLIIIILGVAFWVFIGLIIEHVFRKNTVTKEEADKSNPTRFLGMDFYPRRSEGQVKIPWWFVALLFLFFALTSYYK